MLSTYTVAVGWEDHCSSSCNYSNSSTCLLPCYFIKHYYLQLTELRCNSPSKTFLSFMIVTGSTSAPLSSVVTIVLLLYGCILDLKWLCNVFCILKRSPWCSWASLHSILWSMLIKPVGASKKQNEWFLFSTSASLCVV